MFKDVSKKIGDLNNVLGKVGKSASTDIASGALNDTAFYCRLKTIDFMRQNFDKPVARTLASTLIKPLATPDKTEARIFVNDDGSKGVKPSNWLAAQVSGGSRRQKRMDVGLRLAGVMPEGMQARGVKGALNDAGNLPGGKVKQMLAGLQDQGKAAKWRIARRKADGKPFGVFQMQGARANLFLVFTRKQKYKARYPFHEIIQKAWDAKIKVNYQRRFFERVGQVIGAGIK